MVKGKRTGAKTNQGGYRSGAGRKPVAGEGKAKIKINITIDPDLLEWIDEQTNNRSFFIEQMVTAMKGKILLVAEDNPSPADTGTWNFLIGKSQHTFVGMYQEAKAAAIEIAKQGSWTIIELLSD